MLCNVAVYVGVLGDTRKRLFVTTVAGKFICPHMSAPMLSHMKIRNTPEMFETEA
jgi:hypothetical protein